MMRSRALLAGVAVLLAAGCRHAPKPPEPTGHSSFAFVDQPVTPPLKSEGEVVEPANRAQYREAQLRDPAATPVYPPRALKAASGMPVTVGVRIVVDVSGVVTNVSPSLFVFSTPGPFAGEFFEAVEAAVRQWRFNPSRVEYYEIVTEGGFTFNRITSSETVETTFDLSFTFSSTGAVAPVQAGK